MLPNNFSFQKCHDRNSVKITGEDTPREIMGSKE